MRVAALVLGAVLSGIVTSGPQAPATLDAVIDRASRFAEQQRDELINVRADERYVQRMEDVLGSIIQKRTLVSEIAFVRLTGQEDWVAFRNVIEADGKPTGADPARLEKLFRDATPATQGERIVRESSGYNIGRLDRTLNTPVLVMHLLMSGRVKRFKFKKESEATEASQRVWEVSFAETERPTIIRSAGHNDVPLHGRMWIVPATGAVLRATLEAERPVRSRLEFSWRMDDKLGAWVPAEMRERYFRVRDFSGRIAYDIAGVATYANYRRFGVDVRIK